MEENEKVSRFVYHRGMMLAELDETNQVTGSQYLGNGYIGGYLSERKEESIRNSQSDEKASISKETGKGFSSGSDVDLISKERELCYYIRDEQGSVQYALDQSGNVVNEYQYSAFGETERAEERYENRLRYNGQMYDGLTEQYYLRARYYQPKTGRFTQEDFLYEDGLNLYAYCKSNPVMYCDPSGLAKKPPCDPKVQAEGGSGAKETELFLPDEAYNKQLPKFVTPGTKNLPKYDEFGNLKQIKYYDDYGREIGWIEFTDHGYPDNHTVPHWHEVQWNAQYPIGGYKIDHRLDPNPPFDY